MIKKIFLVIFLYVLLFLLSVFTLYLYISFYISFSLREKVIGIEQVIGIFPNIKEISNIFIFIYIIILIFLFLIVRKREKYIIISIVTFFIILFISIITFYFGYFKKDIFELVDISDDKFTTKYQNIEIKDEENIYTYLFNLKNSEYKSNTLFGKYKEKLDKIENNENYVTELNESEKIYTCYVGNQYLELCEGLPINEYLKNKNYPNILEQTKTFTNILQIINKHNIYKTNGEVKLQYITKQLRSNFYYLIKNLDNNKEIIKYFQEHYNLFSNILNGDSSIIDIVTSITSISILNSQMEYFLSNHNFSKEEKEILYNLLLKIYNNFNEKEIYSNIFKYQYNILKSYIDKGIGNLDLAPQNFLYNYDKTIKLLKNINYFSGINIDKNKIEIIENLFSSENRLNSIFRYNIFGNIQMAIGYVRFDGYFEDLEKTKLDIEKIIKILKNN